MHKKRLNPTDSLELAATWCQKKAPWFNSRGAFFLLKKLILEMAYQKITAQKYPISKVPSIKSTLYQKYPLSKVPPIKSTPYQKYPLPTFTPYLTGQENKNQCSIDCLVEQGGKYKCSTGDEKTESVNTAVGPKLLGQKTANFLFCIKDSECGPQYFGPTHEIQGVSEIHAQIITDLNFGNLTNISRNTIQKQYNVGVKIAESVRAALVQSGVAYRDEKGRVVLPPSSPVDATQC